MPPELKAAKTEGDKGANPSLSLDIDFSSKIDLKAENQTNEKAETKPSVSKEEAKTIFFALLKEKGITAGWKWSRIHDTLENDDRYRIIPRVRDKKQAYQEYIQLIKRNERNAIRNKSEKARAEFRAMLMDFKNLTSDSKYSYCVQFLYVDPRFKEVDDKERESLFQDYLDELWEQEKSRNLEERKIQIEAMKESFKDNILIKPDTKWDEAEKMLSYHPIWQRMPAVDRVEAFSDYILCLEREEAQTRRQSRSIEDRNERLRYREMLESAIQNDEFTFKTKWAGFLKLNSNDKRLLNLFKQKKSLARDIFHDIREIVREKHKGIKGAFKNILKDNASRFSIQMEPEEFEIILAEFDDFKKLQSGKEKHSNSLIYYADYLLIKYKKRVKRAKAKFLKSCVKLLTSSESLTFEAIIPKIENSDALQTYFACMREEEKRQIFEKVLAKSKQGESLASLLPVDKKKKKKIEKSNKKKHEDSDSGSASKSRKSNTPDKLIGKRQQEPEKMVDKPEQQKLKTSGEHKIEEGELEQGEIKINSKELKRRRRHRRRRYSSSHASSSKSKE